MLTVLLVILIVLALGGGAWGYRGGYGYAAPVGGLVGIFLLILLLCILFRGGL